MATISPGPHWSELQLRRGVPSPTSRILISAFTSTHERIVFAVHGSMEAGNAGMCRESGRQGFRMMAAPSIWPTYLPVGISTDQYRQCRQARAEAEKPGTIIIPRPRPIHTRGTHSRPVACSVDHFEGRGLDTGAAVGGTDGPEASATLENVCVGQ